MYCSEIHFNANFRNKINDTFIWTYAENTYNRHVNLLQMDWFRPSLHLLIEIVHTDSIECQLPKMYDNWTFGRSLIFSFEKLILLYQALFLVVIYYVRNVNTSSRRPAGMPIFSAAPRAVSREKPLFKNKI